jgi:GT2 family glycosyltransferase
MNFLVTGQPGTLDASDGEPQGSSAKANRLASFANSCVLLVGLTDTIGHEEAAAAFHRVVGRQPGLHHQLETDENGEICFRTLPEAEWPVLHKEHLLATMSEVEQDPAAAVALSNVFDDNGDLGADLIRATWLGTPDGGSFLVILLPWVVADQYARVLLPALIDAALMGRKLPRVSDFATLMTAECKRQNLLPPTAALSGSAWLRSHGASLRPYETIEIPLTPALWSAVQGLAKAENLTTLAIVWTALALVVERLARGPIAIRTALEWRRRKAADFATLANAVTLSCLLPETKGGSFLSNVRAAMQQHAAAMVQGAGEIVETGGRIVCGFDLQNENEILRENHPRLTIGDAVLWCRDVGHAAANGDLQITMRPPPGDAPGSIRLSGNPSAFGMDYTDVLLPSYIALLEAAVTSPWLAPVGLPYADEAVKLRLLRTASGKQTSSEAIFVLPVLRGAAVYSDVLTADALKIFDLWGFAIDHDHSELLKGGRWLYYAQSVAHQLLTRGGQRPSALIGFGIGGFLAWLVDRLLVAGGWEPTPLISLDGGLPDIEIPEWRDRIAPLLSGIEAASASRMLLLHRAPPGRFKIPRHPELDWANEGVVLTALPCRTVSHEDFVRSSLSAAHGSAIVSYIATGRLDIESSLTGTEIATDAGVLFCLLADELPPTVATVRAFLVALPESPVSYDLRLGLLYLALACGDTELVLQLTERLAAEEPNLRDAFYVRVAWLAELGLSDEAVSMAEAWSRDRSPDPVIHWRAKQKIQAPAAWNTPTELFTGSPDAALDLAAAFGATCRVAPLRVEREAFNFEGQVDFYGYHSRAEGWFIGGWVTYPWPLGRRPEDAVAVFESATLVAHMYSLFYDRPDVSGRGIGFVFFLRSDSPQVGPLTAVRISAGSVDQDIHPTKAVLLLSEQQIVEHLHGALTNSDDLSRSHDMLALLSEKAEVEAIRGLIDFYGYHNAAGGWFFCGWIDRGWPEGGSPASTLVSFDEGYIAGEAVALLYPRQDLADGAEGIAFFVRGDPKPLGKLCGVNFDATGIQASLTSVPFAARLRDVELVARLRPIFGQASACPHRDILLGLLARQPYRGQDTLADLSSPVFLGIDETILSGPDGLVLMGWCLCLPGNIHAIRLRSGSCTTPLNFDGSCIRIERPDVLEAFAQHGFTDTRCGFIAFLPQAVAPAAQIYLEIETTKGEVGYRAVPVPKLEGLAAIKRLLSVVDVRFTEVQHAFDRVLGPAVEGLNTVRLAKRPEINVLEYGRPPTNPRFSIIVPLYGRLDFVEYQLALFSAHRSCADAEFIYVLDDPAKRREAQFLFASVFERFRIPFKAVLLDRNVGFAPANNIGLAQASGRYIVYLNSDVFPGTLDWLEQLSDRLGADPTIGVIGPVLEFEDGSIQHRGMFFTRLPEFGNWSFGTHHDKGLRLGGDAELESYLSITGACMMMARSLANEIGGLDEIYVVGDFEDSDLCLKLQARGYRCMIDPKVRLYHLERKSQASSSVAWRMNLTLYNAWQHERRWANVIAMQQGV